MKTNTSNPAPADLPRDVSATTIFAVLSDPRRRYVLRYVSAAVGAVGVNELAERIAAWEGEPTRDRFERVLVSLTHVHLPKLVDAGIVRHDAERETVALEPAATQLAPYLDLAAPGDT